MADWNRHNGGSFSPPKNLGRPKIQPGEEVAMLLREKILYANSTGMQLSTPILLNFLSDNGFVWSKWKLLRILNCLGYYYGRGERRNILHEAPNNVVFRYRYLQYHFANIEGSNNVPHRPEVFIDESYCHLNQNSPNTWLPHKGVVYTPGRGPLVVIFGAIIVFRNGNTNKLDGEIVLNSVHIWDPLIKPPGNRGRKRNNADAWENIPDVIKNANLVPNQVDYHGNFNADIFENLFDKLCALIINKYGPVDILMDGARYHKRRNEQIPSSSSKKQEIINWLTKKNIKCSDNLCKAELLQLVKNNKEKFHLLV